MPITRLYTDAFSPSDALQLLKEGNFRFLNNMRLHRDLLEEMTHTSDAQRPFAAVLSCMDSRTSGELVFDQGFGDIFSIRNAGNVVTDNVLGSLEYAAAVAGVKLILVMGHANCGAVKGACDRVELGHLTGVLASILPAIEMEHTVTENRTSTNSEFINKVSILNTRNSIQQILIQSPIIAGLVAKKQLAISGALYDVACGKVQFFQE